MTQALGDAAERVSRYLVLQALVNVSFGVLFGIGLYFIGVPNAALWGLIAGILRLVPYVGTLVAAVFPLEPFPWLFSILGCSLCSFCRSMPHWNVIKHEDDLRSIPVVAFTTLDTEESQILACERFANSYVVKPTDLSSFIAKIQAIVSYWV